MTDERRALINGLRDFADFLEANGNTPTPLAARFDVFCINKEEFRVAVKSIGGKLDKKDYSTLLVLRKEFGPIQYDLNIDRELVCERIITGKRTVSAVEAVPEREEDIVEWKCGTVLV